MIYLNPADYHIARIRKSDNMFQSKLDFKDTKFLIKIRYIHKLKKRRASELAFLVIKINKIPTLYLTLKNMLTYYHWKEKTKSTMFLLRILSHSCTIILYIVKKSIFAIIVYQISAWKKIKMPY